MSDPVTPKQELSTVEGERRLNQVASAFTFVPKSITEAMEVSKAIASSELCPRDYLGHKNPAASILVAVMTGAKYGLDPKEGGTPACVSPTSAAMAAWVGRAPELAP